MCACDVSMCVCVYGPTNPQTGLTFRSACLTKYLPNILLFRPTCLIYLEKFEVTLQVKASESIKTA